MFYQKWAAGRSSWETVKRNGHFIGLLASQFGTRSGSVWGPRDGRAALPYGRSL